VTHWNVDRAGIERSLIELQSVVKKKVGHTA